MVKVSSRLAWHYPINIAEVPVRIGPFHITRLHRHRVEKRYELPWDVLTLEHLSPAARAIIARCARAAAKDYLEEQREQENTR